MKDTILKLDPSEVVELEINRHSISLVSIFATGALLTIAILFVPAIMRNLQGDFLSASIAESGYITLGSIILALLVIGVTFIAAYVDRNNKLIVTNENIIQILQFSLFNTQVSQLSLEKVQDITSTQKGILAKIFNYGTIFIETAGETANFGFSKVPDPLVSSKHINEAHERFIKKYGIDVI